MIERLSKLEFLEEIERLEKNKKLLDDKMTKSVVSQESIELFKIRLSLQEKILNILNDLMFDTNFIRNPKQEDIKFLKEYREFINKYRRVYPLFIFGGYEKEKFSKYLDYMKSGHTLVETESFYCNSLGTFKNKKM